MWRSEDSFPARSPETNSQQGICAGKHAIAEYLIQHQGFQLLELAKPHRSNTDDSDDDLRFRASEIRKTGEPQSEFVFETADALLDFVTKRWSERWVTADIANEGTLDRFILRPFFLLVSVDAPVSLRWKRFTDRFVIAHVYFAVPDSLSSVVQMLATTSRSTRSRAICPVE